MSLIFATAGHDATAYACGLAVMNGAGPGGLTGVEGLPTGWRCSIAGFAADVCVEPDLVVIVSGSPRRTDPGGDVAATRPVSAREIAAAWRTAGPASLARLSANFALVIAEPATGKVHGYLDPFGLNSLFCAAQPGPVVFCTEALAVTAASGAALVDTAALRDVINLRVLAGRRALWAGVRQVLPGTLLTLDGRGEPVETRIGRVRFEPSDRGDTLAAAAIDVRSMMSAAFERRRDEGMDHVAVPLSGGVDSSILAALAVRTFPNATAFTASIEGFDNPETERAREVARRLGIRHRIVDVTDADVARLYPHVIGRVQEPPRHFNNMVIARLMETMCEDCGWIIAGDTADQMFGSGILHSVRQFAVKRRVMDGLPRPLQRALARGLWFMPGRRPASLARIAESSLDELIQSYMVIPRSVEGSARVRAFAPDRKPSAELVAAHYEPGLAPYEAYQTWNVRTFERSVYRRNERLSRARGLRYWYPFLEPAILEFVTRMPSAMKADVKHGLSKPILRLVCAELAGRDVSTWSKLGFPSPEREWMTGPLSAHLEDCLADDAAIAAFFDPAAVRGLDVRRDHQLLWTLMTLESVLDSARSATARR